MLSIARLLEMSAARHSHLCPRQVLGVRMGLAGLTALGIEPPLTKSTGMVIVETDGCFVDGIEVATGATVGHRTLRVVDMGKIAATFIDAARGNAIRFAPRRGVRTEAFHYAPMVTVRYEAQLQGYTAMPDASLFSWRGVRLRPSLAALLSQPDARTSCEECGEEIINERQVLHDGRVLCRSCAGAGYFEFERGEQREEGASAEPVRAKGGLK
jgi:formylmethanofuran dehydrogenase subunit E